MVKSSVWIAKAKIKNKKIISLNLGVVFLPTLYISIRLVDFKWWQIFSLSIMYINLLIIIIHSRTGVEWLCMTYLCFVLTLAFEAIDLTGWISPPYLRFLLQKYFLIFSLFLSWELVKFCWLSEYQIKVGDFFG